MEICSKKRGTKTRQEETERQRGETKRREEKVRGTAQESFSHEATQHKKQTTKIKKNNTPITTYSKKDRAVNDPCVPSSSITSLWRTEKNDDDSDNTDFRDWLHHHDIWPRDSDMHKLYTWHQQGFIESQLLAGRLRGRMEWLEEDC